MNRLFWIAFLTACCMAATAHARTGDLPTQSWPKWQELGALTNCDDAAINSAVVCGDTGGIKTEGYNALTLEISYTQSAGTGWEFYLETCHEGHGNLDCTDAADWHRATISQVVPGTGVMLTADPVAHLAAASDRVVYSVGINYLRVRLAGFVATGTPDANDKITVNARVGWLPAY